MYILNYSPAKIAEIYNKQSETDEILQKFIQKADAKIKPLSSNFEQFCKILNIKPDSTRHPFVLAILESRPDIIHLFLSFYPQNFDINSEDNDGKTAAHAAAMTGNIQLLEELPDLDLNRKDKFGNTPLHCAIMGHQKEVIQFLIERSITLDEPNSGTYTPLQLAQMENLRHIEKDLLDAGVEPLLD